MYGSSLLQGSVRLRVAGARYGARFAVFMDPVGASAGFLYRVHEIAVMLA